MNFVCFTLQVLHIFYRTCFHRFYIEATGCSIQSTYTVYHTHLLYMFSEVSDRSCNYKGVKLPSGCVVPGSRSIHTFGCCFVNCRGGLKRWTISGFLVLLGWVPCQVGTRSVKLAGLSSKSTCNLCVAFGVQGAVLASAFLCPVCSISWMGSSREEGPFPHGELDKIDLVFVCKVGDILLVEFKVGVIVECRILRGSAVQFFSSGYRTHFAHFYRTRFTCFVPYTFS